MSQLDDERDERDERDWSFLTDDQTLKALVEKDPFKTLKKKNPDLAEAFVRFLQAVKKKGAPYFKPDELERHPDELDDRFNWYDIIRDACRKLAEHGPENRDLTEKVIAAIENLPDLAGVRDTLKAVLDTLSAALATDSQPPPPDPITQAMQDISESLKTLAKNSRKKAVKPLKKRS